MGGDFDMFEQFIDEMLNVNFESKIVRSNG